MNITSQAFEAERETQRKRARESAEQFTRELKQLMTQHPLRNMGLRDNELWHVQNKLLEAIALIRHYGDSN